MKKRYFKPRDRSLPKGYDSKLEYRLHETALKDCQHHPSKEDLIRYATTHTYEYDFLLTHEDSLLVIETKGRFRESSESRKYLFVRDHLEDWDVYQQGNFTGVELVFIFEKASTPMPFAKKRKDGTKQTHGEWATRNKFRWLCEHRGDLENVLTREDLLNTLNTLN